jgi:hypothetical protein
MRLELASRVPSEISGFSYFPPDQTLGKYQEFVAGPCKCTPNNDSGEQVRLDFRYENGDTCDYIVPGMAEVDSSGVFFQTLATLGCVKILIARSLKRYCDVVDLLNLFMGHRAEKGQSCGKLSEALSPSSWMV